MINNKKAEEMSVSILWNCLRMFGRIAKGYKGDNNQHLGNTCEG